MREKHHDEPYLKNDLSSFAEPATLLAGKVEMYRHLPYLRKQIEGLRDSGDFEISHLVLDTVDVAADRFGSPVPDSESRLGPECHAGIHIPHPADSNQMQPGCRRSACPDKLDASGRCRDAAWYMEQCMGHAPELRGFEQRLTECIQLAERKVLTQGSGMPVRSFPLHRWNV